MKVPTKRMLTAIAKAQLAACEAYLEWCMSHTTASPTSHGAYEATAKAMLADLERRGFTVVKRGIK